MSSEQADRALPGPVQAELTRLRAEREVFVQRQESLEIQRRETDLELQAVKKHRDELLRQACHLTDLRMRAEEADALTHDVNVARLERDALRAELADTRTERDRLRLRLLNAESLLAMATHLATPPERDSAADKSDLDASEQRASELARELAATRDTVSWRITTPLRALRRRVGKR